MRLPVSCRSGHLRDRTSPKSNRLTSGETSSQNCHSRFLLHFQFLCLSLFFNGTVTICSHSPSIPENQAEHCFCELNCSFTGVSVPPAGSDLPPPPPAGSDQPPPPELRFWIR